MIRALLAEARGPSRGDVAQRRPDYHPNPFRHGASTTVHPPNLAELSLTTHTNANPPQSAARPSRRGDRAWQLLRYLTQRAAVQRYKGSLLGLVWTLVTPLIMVAAYWVVFKFLFGSPIPNYALFIFVGMIGWAMVFGSILLASSSITGNPTLVTKARIPRELIPFSVVAANCVSVIAMLAIAVPLCLVFPQGSALPLIAAGLILALQLITALGLGLVAAGLNVYFRDVEHILTAISLPWFFLTPIFYTFAQVSETVTNQLALDVLHYGNPLAPGIIALQDSLFWGTWPSWPDVLYTLVFAGVCLCGGMLLFRKLKRDMAVVL